MASIDQRVESEVHYMRHDTAMAEFEKDLGESLAFEDLTNLAVAMRNRDAPAVLKELNQYFGRYWSAIVRNRIVKEEAELKRACG